MANQTKQYFLAPTWDYPPNGPISLGNIILSPSRPVPALVPAAAAINTTPTPTTWSTTKRNVHWAREHSHTSCLGLWTKFVELVGLRLDWVAAGHTVDVFRFEQLQTEEWFPDEAFLTAALAHPAVQRRVGGWRRRAVYVVVGVKTVAGAEVKRAWYRGVQGARAEAAVDVGMAAGAPVPVTVGGGVAAGWEAKEGMAFEGGDKFVFAYRVQKVWLRRDETVGRRDYTKGTMLGVEDGEKAAERLEIGRDVVVEESLANEDLGDGWYASRVVEDEGEGQGEVAVFVPRITGDGTHENDH